MQAGLRSRICLLLLLHLTATASYWQQKIQYNIQVDLDDTEHVIQGHETLTYINNSPDTLAFIWIHLWPNAYRDNNTALARQRFSQFSTRMYFFPENAFGWIELEQLQAGGRDLHWEYRSADTLDVARFFLTDPLTPGDTLIMDMTFKLKIPQMVSRLGHAGNHYELTQWYPKPAVYDATGWHPMSYLETGEYYSEWADFRVTIGLPANYRVAATGILQDTTEIAWRDSLALVGQSLLDSLSFMKPKHISALQPLASDQPSSAPDKKSITFIQTNVHDFAWFADKRFIVTGADIQLPSGRSVRSWTFSLPQDLVNYRFSNNYSQRAIKQYSDWYMEYPYDQVSIVDGEDTPGGGMEYPMITLINNSGFPPFMEVAIIHEIAHNWFYGLAASNERSHPWMDEGLTTYTENRYWRSKYPDDAALAFEAETPAYVPLARRLLKHATKSALEELAFYGIAQRGTDQPATLATEDFDPGNYYPTTYGKTGTATALLHAYLGDEQMDSIWHTFFRDWAYKHPGPQDLRTHFETQTGQDLSWYFDDLLGSSRKSDFAVAAFETHPVGDHWRTQVSIENRGQLVLPLPLSLQGADLEAQGQYWVTPRQPVEEFFFETPYAVTDVILDPDQLTLDMDRRNNRRHRHLAIDLMQVDINPMADYRIGCFPYLWYDSVDRIIPGMIFLHHDLIPWGGVDWYLRSYYGPRTETLGLSASMSKKFFPEAGREVQLRSRVGRDWYYHLLEVSGSFQHQIRSYPELQDRWDLSLLNMDISQDGIVVDGDTVQYLDPEVWTHDQHARLAMAFSRSTRQTLLEREFGIQATMGSTSGSSLWIKLQTHLILDKRLSRKMAIRTTVFAGFASPEVPAQERFYLSTDMDPTLNNPLILSRNGDWYTPGHVQLYETPYTLPGFLYDETTGRTPNTRALMGLKVAAQLPPVPNLSLLLGTALVQAENGGDWDLILSLSPIYELGPWQIIYTPFTLTPKGAETHWDRFQLTFDLDQMGLPFGL